MRSILLVIIALLLAGCTSVKMQVLPTATAAPRPTATARPFVLPTVTPTPTRELFKFLTPTATPLQSIPYCWCFPECEAFCESLENR